jgi:uncharacterized protein YydD (DUF2326 family)
VDAAHLRADTSRQGEIVMAVAARKFERETSMEARVARLEEKTDHIQSDVAEIKADLRKMDAKFDGKIDELKKDVSALRVEMKDSFTKVQGEMKDSFAKIQGEMKDSFAKLQGEMKDSFSALQGQIGKINVGRALDKVWMLLMLGAILGVMAHGFKWI